MRRTEVANYTTEVTEICARRAVWMVDLHDERPLFISDVSLEESLGNCGCSPQECGDMEAYINKYRSHQEKPELEVGTITVETTIRELIDHVC